MPRGDFLTEPLTPDRTWAVGALVQTVANLLDARLNPVTVRGEISGLSRAASGHCYFALKDAGGQLRCVMFRRAANFLDAVPRDGEAVELEGRLAIYEPRGDLQLIVESLRRAGAGALFEQFLQRKARLEAEGLFDAARKRPLPALPRAIGLVTSLGAAALHDAATALRRRLPHIPVLLMNAAVQGADAPAQLVHALDELYRRSGEASDGLPPIDVILLVRGGGSIEDLWAFNDESLARTIVRSPVPVVVGVGHETDFTIADLCADLRAPTPTAAAELVAPPRAQWLAALDTMQERLVRTLARRLDDQAQRLDRAGMRLGRPSSLTQRERLTLGRQAHRLQFAMQRQLGQLAREQQQLQGAVIGALQGQATARAERLSRLALRLQSLNPSLVLRRGYAWIANADGAAVTSATQLSTGDRARATWADGSVDLRVIDAPVADKSTPPLPS
ncbi:MAG: exodeoxyribonuclease VII large subunit [Variovorax sp.]